MPLPRPHATNPLGTSIQWHYDRLVSIAQLASVPSNSSGFGFGAIVAAGSTFNTQVIAFLAAIAIVTPYAIRTYRRNVVGRTGPNDEPTDEGGAGDDDPLSSQALAEAQAGPTASLSSFADQIDRWSDHADDLADRSVRTLDLPASVRNGAESLPAKLALAALADSARQNGWALGQVDVAADGSLSASFSAVLADAEAPSADDGGALTSDSE